VHVLVVGQVFGGGQGILGVAIRSMAGSSARFMNM